MNMNMKRLAGVAICGGVFAAMIGAAGCTTFQEKVRTYQAVLRVEQGQRFLVEDDLESALAEFERAVKLDPRMAEAHSNIGEIYRRMGEVGKAIEAFKNAVYSNPYSFKDTFNLAQLYHLTRRLKDAVEVYLAAIDLAPEHYDSQLSLGVCYQQMGEGKLAVERFNKAVAIDPDRPHAYSNLGVVLDGQQKHYEAIAAYQASLERDNHQPPVLVNMANTYMNQGRLKIARATLEQAVHMDPSFAPSQEALGYCLFRLKDYDEATVAYIDALSLDSHLAKAHVGLGSIDMINYLSDKSRGALRDSAVEHWHRSLELNPDQPLVRDLLDKYRMPAEDPYRAFLGVQEAESDR